jgi:hypothetical protein
MHENGTFVRLVQICRGQPNISFFNKSCYNDIVNQSSASETNRM